MQAGNHIYLTVTKLLKSKLVSRKIKVKLYKIIRPVVTYGCKSCYISSKEEASLRIFERTIIKRI